MVDIASLLNIKQNTPTETTSQDNWDKLQTVISLYNTYKSYKKASGQSKIIAGLNLLQKLQNLKYLKELDKLQQEQKLLQQQATQEQYKSEILKKVTPITPQQKTISQKDQAMKKIMSYVGQGITPPPTWSDRLLKQIMFIPGAFANLWGGLTVLPAAGALKSAEEYLIKKAGAEELKKRIDELDYKRVHGGFTPAEEKEWYSLQEEWRKKLGSFKQYDIGFFKSLATGAAEGVKRGELGFLESVLGFWGKQLPKHLQEALSKAEKKAPWFYLYEQMPKEIQGVPWGEIDLYGWTERMEESKLAPEDTILGKVQRMGTAPTKTGLGILGGLHNTFLDPAMLASLMIEFNVDPLMKLNVHLMGNIMRGGSTARALQVEEKLGEVEKVIMAERFTKPIQSLTKKVNKIADTLESMRAEQAATKVGSKEWLELEEQIRKYSQKSNLDVIKLFEKQTSKTLFETSLKKLRPLAMQFAEAEAKAAPFITWGEETLMTWGQFESAVNAIIKTFKLQKPIDYIKATKVGKAIKGIKDAIGKTFIYAYGQDARIVNMDRIYRAAGTYRVMNWAEETLYPTLQKLKEAGLGKDLVPYLEMYSVLRRFDGDLSKVPETLLNNANVKKWLNKTRIRAWESHPEVKPILDLFFETENAEIRALEQAYGIDVGYIDNYIYQYLSNRGLTKNQIKAYQYSYKKIAPEYEREVESILQHIAMGDKVKTNALELAMLRREASFKALMQKQFLHDVGLTFGSPTKIERKFGGLAGYSTLPQATFKELKGLSFPDEIANTLMKWREALTPPGELTVVGKMYDLTLTLWKASVTSGIALPNPYFMLRNLLTSGVTYNLLALGKTWFYPRLKKTSLKFVLNDTVGGQNLTGRIFLKGLGREIEMKDLYRLVVESGVMNMTFAETELGTRIANAMSRFGMGIDQSPAELILKYSGSKAFRQMNAFIEKYARTENFIGSLMNGLTPEQALLNVKKWHFFYNELTPAERVIGKRLFPFYAWARNNIPLQIQLLLQKPLYSRMIEGIRQAMSLASQRLGTEEGVEFLADWEKEDGWVILPGQKTKEGTPLMVQPSMLPIQDLGILTSPLKQIVGSYLSPIFKIPVELATKRNVYTGAELSEDLVRVPDWMNNDFWKKAIGVKPMKYTDENGIEKMGVGVPKITLYKLNQIPIFRQILALFPATESNMADFAAGKMFTGIPIKPFDINQVELNWWRARVREWDKQYDLAKAAGEIIEQPTKSQVIYPVIENELRKYPEIYQQVSVATSLALENLMEEAKKANKTLTAEDFLKLPDISDLKIDLTLQVLNQYPDNDPVARYLKRFIRAKIEEYQYQLSKKQQEILEKGIKLGERTFTPTEEVIKEAREETKEQKTQAAKAFFGLEEAKLPDFQEQIAKYERLRLLAQLIGNDELANQIDYIIAELRNQYYHNKLALYEKGIGYEGEKYIPSALETLQVRQDAIRSRYNLLKQMMGLQ